MAMCAFTSGGREAVRYGFARLPGSQAFLDVYRNLLFESEAGSLAPVVVPETSYKPAPIAGSVSSISSRPALPAWTRARNASGDGSWRE